MEVSKKITERIIVRRSNEEDCKNILDFHRKQIRISQPAYLKRSLESQSGLSIVAYQSDKVVGHILLLPLTSQRDATLEEAAILEGIWCIDKEILDLLIKEAIMCAWEYGFHAIFSFENNIQLKKTGFVKTKKDFFAMNVSGYTILGMELSWNGFKKIPHDLTIPVAFLPPINKLNQFSKN
jgi:hypothetical protein